MDFASFFHQKQYHRIVICWSRCKGDEDFLFLCLALYAIGRKNTAVALLNARTELVSSIESRVVYLRYLRAITGNAAYSDEIQHWTSLPDWKKTALSTDIALPDCEPVSLCVQVQKFKRAGATVQIGSFAESCIQDQKNSQEMLAGGDYGPIMFMAVAGGGLVEEVVKQVQSNEVARWARRQKSDIKKIRMPFQGDFFEHVDVIRRIADLAAYSYLVGDDASTATYCKLVLQCVFSFQAQEKADIDLQGVLAYEVQTVAFMALDVVDTAVADEDLSLFLEAILYKGFCSEEISVKNLPSASAFLNEDVKLPLRESKLLASCGHANRVKAAKQASPVTVVFDGKPRSGTLMARAGCIEAARNYIIAAALDASDSPEVVAKYDQALWCLLLAGGIDLVVVRLFVRLRSYHQRNLFFAFSEPRARCLTETRNAAWPTYANSADVLEMIYHLYDRCGDWLSVRRLSPTIIESAGRLYVSTTFLCTQNEFTQSGRWIEHAQAGTIKFTRNDLVNCIKDSRCLAQLWYDCYLECHKVMPAEFERLYHDQIMAPLSSPEARPKSPLKVQERPPTACV